MGIQRNCKFSVVVPVYNSAPALTELKDRLSTVFNKMGASYEIIFVNDHSKDNSYAILREIFKADQKHVVVIDLLKNHGQHNALMCGFNHCTGEIIITIDDDLQNPPEEIPTLYDELESGYDVVFGIPKEKKHKAYKNLGSLMVRKLNRKIFNLKGDHKFSNYRIIRREIIDEIKSIKTPYPYISGMLLNVTTSIGNTEVKHDARQYGSSNYGIRRLTKLALNLLINYSSIPLRTVGIFGISASVISLIIGLIFIIKQLFIGKAPEGWTTLVVLVSFYNAVMMFFFSIIGEYIFRILKESSGHSQYAVRSVLAAANEEKIEQFIDSSIKPEQQ